MNNVTVIGTQWGDEGKGKIVDWLSAKADVVVRFQGGHNAGHTLVVNGITYKLSLLPSGVVRGKLGIIGNGVVVDPLALLKEMETVRAQGLHLSPETLQIADTAPIILPLHAETDKAREASKGAGKIGTTGRGIGPAYEDKVGRRALRMGDLLHPETLPAKIDNLLHHHNALRRGYGLEALQAGDVLGQLTALTETLRPFIHPTWRVLAAAQQAGKKILFEGAQGLLLDIDHGTYPFVTSSSTIAGNAAAGSGVSPKALGYILGITKAYTTRVGSGPFPTEQDNATGELLGTRGHEFGTVTGRKRRCGWFDAVLVRQAIQLSGVDGIALTKLDVLDGMPDIMVNVGYDYQGQRFDYLPSHPEVQAAITPVYQRVEGWQGTTAGAKTWDELPPQAVRYVRLLEELLQTPVALVSTSPKREDTILVQDPFG